MAQAQFNGRTGSARRSRRGRSDAHRQATPGADEAAIVSRIGPLEIDWPRSLGFFGGVALAVGIGLIDPPVGLFIAAVPFLKMLDTSKAPRPSRFVGQIIEGMAKPVGGDSQGTVRVASAQTGTNDGPVGQAN